MTLSKHDRVTCVGVYGRVKLLVGSAGSMLNLGVTTPAMLCGRIMDVIDVLWCVPGLGLVGMIGHGGQGSLFGQVWLRWEGHWAWGWQVTVLLPSSP